MTSAIVCGVDGSADARAALTVAERYARRLGARLVLVHVVEHVPVPYAATVGLGAGAVAARPLLPELGEEQMRAGERLLEDVAHALGVDEAERRVVYGHPAERLADIADEEGAELIVVGSRGHGAIRAAFLGSVSSSLVGVARCPVLVVPPGAS